MPRHIGNPQHQPSAGDKLNDPKQDYIKRIKDHSTVMAIDRTKCSHNGNNSVAQATTGRMPADNSKAPPLRSNHPWGKPTCNTAENSNNQQQETSPPSWTQQTNWLYRATRGTSSPLQEIEPTKQLQEAQHIRLHIAASTATPAARRGSSKPSSNYRKGTKWTCI